MTFNGKIIFAVLVFVIIVPFIICTVFMLDAFDSTKETWRAILIERKVLGE
jgi:hypothetical protein